MQIQKWKHIDRRTDGQTDGRTDKRVEVSKTVKLNERVHQPDNYQLFQYVKVNKKIVN